MKCVIQRVSCAKVSVEGQTIGEIGQGLLILLGIEEQDTGLHAAAFAAKTASLRIFEDENGKMNRSLLDIGGGALVVPNFTLCANCRRGTRPSFSAAREPEEANALFEEYTKRLLDCGIQTVQKGRFGADMQVSLVNDGPVTILLSDDDVNLDFKG